MNKFWMCYVEGKTAPVKVHESKASARIEAERLARLTDNIGRRVFILESISYCQIQQVPVTWFEICTTYVR